MVSHLTYQSLHWLIHSRVIIALMAQGCHRHLLRKPGKVLGKLHESCYSHCSWLLLVKPSAESVRPFHRTLQSTIEAWVWPNTQGQRIHAPSSHCWQIREPLLVHTGMESSPTWCFCSLSHSLPLSTHPDSWGQLFSCVQRAWALSLGTQSTAQHSSPVCHPSLAHSIVYLHSDSKLHLSHWPENSVLRQLDTSEWGKRSQTLPCPPAHVGYNCLALISLAAN
jgi:hypothetical protein